MAPSSMRNEEAFFPTFHPSNDFPSKSDIHPSDAEFFEEVHEAMSTSDRKSKNEFLINMYNSLISLSAREAMNFRSQHNGQPCMQIRKHILFSAAYTVQ
jgi:hypothetical protein